jgi:beta-N-acetylhexosaminidase
MVDVAGASLTSEDRTVLSHPLIGGVILFTRNYVDLEQLSALIAEIRAVRQPPLLVAVDHEGGRVQRFRQGFTVLPSMRLIGHQFKLDRSAGLDLARQCGWLMAAELRGIGVDLSFAPVVDLDYGASTVIGDRAFDRNPETVAELAIAFAHGMRDAGMIATAKHFPGHGAVIADSHVALPVDKRAYADMVDDLHPYRRLIENGLPAVMMAHVVYAQVDAQPAGFSSLWIKEELRHKLRFNGAIFSDDLNMEGASIAGDVPSRVKAALAAGCDMTPICNNRPGVLASLSTLDVETLMDPVSQVRLARLHGAVAPARSELLASAEWNRCHTAALRCQERPVLKLEGSA